jgi:ribosomal protein S27E
LPTHPHRDDDEEMPVEPGRRFTEFDCPACNANNPADEPFGDGDEIRCFYCGQELAVQVSEGGRLKLREI